MYIHRTITCSTCDEQPSYPPSAPEHSYYYKNKPNIQKMYKKAYYYLQQVRSAAVTSALSP